MPRNAKEFSRIALTILHFACGLWLAGGECYSQQYLISTVAGGAPPSTPVTALNASFEWPSGVAVDGIGNLYFAALNCVFKVNTNGVMTLIAGSGTAGYSGDGGPAVRAQVNFVNVGGAGYGYAYPAIAADGQGDIYITDTVNSRIRRVSPAGIITTVAGNGTNGFSADGNPAASGPLNISAGLAVDAQGNLYITDNGRIRKVSAAGIITTVAGGGTASPGDNGSALSAQLDDPTGLAIDGQGNIFIADTYDQRVRKVSASGIITTVAGNGSAGYSGDNGPATAAQLRYPSAVAADGQGNIFISDVGNQVIRKVSSNGTITTAAGSLAAGYTGDGGPAINAQLDNPLAVAADGQGNIFISDTLNRRVRKVSAAGIISTVAGSGAYNYSGNGGPAAISQLGGPKGVSVDRQGNIFVADYVNSRVRKVTAAGLVSTVAGNGTNGYAGDGGLAIGAELSGPTGIAVDAQGNLYIADDGKNVVRKVSTGGIISTVAGTGTAGYSGDGGTAASAQLRRPEGVAVDSQGNLYIADEGNYLIRKVSQGGTITTVAGVAHTDVPPEGNGDGGLATSAFLYLPKAVSVDGQGNLFVVDDNAIRKVSTGGIITTVAGAEGPLGYSGDGGQATDAQFTSPTGVATDGLGNIIICDEGNYRVREVSPDGVITTIAGTGVAASSGDGGPGATAQINPYGVAADVEGNVYVTDSMANTVRLLRPTSQSVLVSAVVDAASESATPISPGQIVAIYGAGLGPSQLVVNQPSDGAFGTQLAGTSVSFNGTAAPLIYTSANGVAAIVPYAVSGATSAQVTVTYQGQTSSAFTVAAAASAPSFFSVNGTGAGQIAAVNLDGTINGPAHPVSAGGYISLYATGEGQTNPAGVDGQLALMPPYPQPLLPVTLTIGGQPATLPYAGASPTSVAGLMQIVALVPPGVQPGGYVPVVLQVGNASTVEGAAWIAVASN